MNAVERKPVETRVLNPTASEASYKTKQGCVTMKDMQVILKKDHLIKVTVNGAQCSESNGKNNKKILRFLFFELSSKIWVIFFGKNTLK